MIHRKWPWLLLFAALACASCNTNDNPKKNGDASDGGSGGIEKSGGSGGRRLPSIYVDGKPGITRLAMQAFFDAETEKKFRTIGVELRKIGVSSGYGFRPHITVGSWDKVDTETLPDSVERLKKAMTELSEQPVLLDFDPGTNLIFMRPRVTRQIEQFHADLHNKLGFVGTGGRPIDRPGAWKSSAHVTVTSSIGAGLADQAADIVRAEFSKFPVAATISYVSFVIYPNGLMASYELTGREN